MLRDCYVLLIMDDNEHIHPMTRPHHLLGIYDTLEAAETFYNKDTTVEDQFDFYYGTQVTVAGKHHYTDEPYTKTYAIVRMYIRKGN